MAENTGSTGATLKDTPRLKNTPQQYPWTCSKCENSNNPASRTCSKCRAMRTQAKQWKCGKCEKMMRNGITVCPDCNLDMNGFSMDW